MDWLSKHQFAGAVLDALSANICVLDQDGTIVGVNAAWRRFSRDNGGRSDYIGTNYAAICRRTGGRGAAAAGRLAHAIEQILAGQQQYFEIEYPCHGPRERRWFLASVTALPTPEVSPGQGAVISHADITSRKKLELQLKRTAETDELSDRLRMGLRIGCGVIHGLDVDTTDARPHGRDRAEDEALSDRSH